RPPRRPDSSSWGWRISTSPSGLWHRTVPPGRVTERPARSVSFRTSAISWREHHLALRSQGGVLLVSVAPLHFGPTRRPEDPRARADPYSAASDTLVLSISFRSGSARTISASGPPGEACGSRRTITLSLPSRNRRTAARCPTALQLNADGAAVFGSVSSAPKAPIHRATPKDTTAIPTSQPTTRRAEGPSGGAKAAPRRPVTPVPAR